MPYNISYQERGDDAVIIGRLAALFEEMGFQKDDIYTDGFIHTAKLISLFERVNSLSLMRILPPSEYLCPRCGDDLDIEPAISYGGWSLAEVDVEFRLGCMNHECAFEAMVTKKVSFTKQDMIDADVGTSE
jgi:hypothetical protein